MKTRSIINILLPLLLFVPVLTCQSARAAAPDAVLADAWTAYNIGDYKKTLRLLLPLAQEGNARAQVLVGRCCENGLGTPQDLESAAKWYRLAAEQNDSEAQVLLAYCHEVGAGVPVDSPAVVRLMAAAANAGNAEAQFNLAVYYGQGRHGLPKYPEESFLWAKRSADQGYGQAALLVAAAYEHGIGAPKDPAEAALWYARAAAQGFVKDGAVFTRKREYPLP
jgi:TPR repeat protein